MLPGLNIHLRRALTLVLLILVPAIVQASDISRPDPQQILRELLLVWTGDDALHFSLELRSEADGPVIESVDIAMSKHSRVIEYTAPHRYRGDVLMMDGVRLHLEEDDGHESLRPTVFRDLQNRELMWLASQLFGDFWQDFEFSQQDLDSTGRVAYHFAEKEPLAPVELIKINLNKAGLPVSGQLFDHERDEIWDLEFSLGNKLQDGGSDLPLLSFVTIKTSDGTPYHLSLRDMRRGALDHQLQGHVSSHE